MSRNGSDRFLPQVSSVGLYPGTKQLIVYLIRVYVAIVIPGMARLGITHPPAGAAAIVFSSA